jgi:hypothetical protein
VARLIDVSAEDVVASPLVVRVGDVLAFAASGGDVRPGPPVVERLGPFLPAVVGLDGRVLAPEGMPSAVLFVARAPGRATLDVASTVGSPAPRLRTYVVVVEP